MFNYIHMYVFAFVNFSKNLAKSDVGQSYHTSEGNREG